MLSAAATSSRCCGSLMQACNPGRSSLKADRMLQLDRWSLGLKMHLGLSHHFPFARWLIILSFPARQTSASDFFWMLPLGLKDAVFLDPLVCLDLYHIKNPSQVTECKFCSVPSPAFNPQTAFCTCVQVTTTHFSRDSDP